MRRVLMGLTTLLLQGALQASGDHGVSPGPITALSSFAPAVALAQRRASVPDVQLVPQQWQTAEGLRVSLWQTDALPMLDVRLVFDAGSARDGAQFGLAAATASLLDEGTRQRDARAIAEGFERQGADFSATALRDMALVQLRVLADPAHRDPALALFAEVASEPQFTADAWQRLRDAMEIGQRQRQQSPAGRAALVFQSRLYGDHPYAHPTTGTLATLDALRPDDLARFHRQFYTAANGALVLVGAIDRAGAEALAADISRRLPAGPPPPPLPAVTPLAASKRVNLPFATQQTHVLLGEVGIPRGDPDHFPLMVANELLAGGGFGSLLMRELREKRGLTYGVSSGFQPMREAGTFQISFSTRADQAEEALALTQRLFSEFVARGPSTEDVKRAIDSLAQSFPRSLAGNAQVANYLGMMAFYGLPTDYLATYLQRLRAVTPDQVRSALSRRLHPDRLLVVTAGPKP